MRTTKTSHYIELIAAILSIFATLFIWLLGLSMQSYAQSPLATISGTVEDVNGGRLPGAMIAVTKDATGQRLQTTANGDGEIRLVNVPYGKYRIEVTLTGFAKKTINDLM